MRFYNPFLAFFIALSRQEQTTQSAHYALVTSASHNPRKLLPQNKTETSVTGGELYSRVSSDVRCTFWSWSSTPLTRSGRFILGALSGETSTRHRSGAQTLSAPPCLLFTSRSGNFSVPPPSSSLENAHPCVCVFIYLFINV